MIDGLKPYPATKDSGVPWLGEVPEHWEILSGRACYRGKKVPNKGLKEKTILSLSYGRVIIKPQDKMHGLVPASFETYQVVDPGEIVVRPTDLQNDRTSLRFGHSKDRGIITSAYIVLQTTGLLNDAYGYNLLNAYDLKKVFYGLGSGLRQNLDWVDFKALPCLVPSKDEQSAIVRFLGHVDRKIQRAIRAKQKLIKLLEEEKQVLIHRAVTGQIDVRTGKPYPAYKPSGVEWLGKIPQSWRVTRFKFIASDIVDCLHATPRYDTSGEFPAIRTADVEPGRLRLVTAKRVSEAEFAKWTARLEPREEDILYSREGERYGIAALVPPQTRLCISQRMMVFRIRAPHCSAYFMWQLNCPHIYAQASQDLGGATAPHVNVERIKNFWMAVPSPQEQLQLVAQLEPQLERLQGIRSRLDRQISLLFEYRTRLVADVVTGKLDVRDAAARLPAEPEAEVEATEPDEDLDLPQAAEDEGSYDGGQEED